VSCHWPHHGLGDRADLADGALDLDTRVWVWVVLVTLLGALLCREWRVRLSLLLELGLVAVYESDQ